MYSLFIKMFVQSDKKNEWYWLKQWQYEIIKMRPNYNFTNNDIKTNRFNSGRGQTIIKHSGFTYVLYYKCSNHQGYDIPILLNLNTCKSRIMYDSEDKKHKGAINDAYTAMIFRQLIINKNIPNI